MTGGENSDKRDFTPALGAHWLTPFYDFAIAGFTRERAWRGALIELVDPQTGDLILDVGCGTGSLAVALAKTCRVLGVDPDPAVLARAGRKAAAAGVKPAFVCGFFSEKILPDNWRPTKVVSSLVLHQTPVAEKRRIIKEIHALLPPGGVFCLADYGRQSPGVQRFLFRNMVQRVDGFENTTPNMNGVIEELLAETGFDGAAPRRVIATLTGGISLWRAVRR